MRDFFYMSGYAGYVWSAYAIAMIVLAWNIMVPVIQKRKLQKRIRKVHQQEQN